MSAWIQHIKAFAAKNNLSYGCALSNPECSRSYRASKEKKVGLQESMPDVNPKNISMKGIEIKKPYVPPAPPVKASRKVFADPFLMGMIEGFKPKLTASDLGRVEYQFEQLRYYEDNLYHIDSQVGEKLNKKRAAELQDAIDYIDDVRQDWQRYIEDTYGLNYKWFDKIESDSYEMAEAIINTDDDEPTYDKTSFDDYIPTIFNAARVINRNLEELLNHRLSAKDGERQGKSWAKLIPAAKAAAKAAAKPKAAAAEKPRRPTKKEVDEAFPPLESDKPVNKNWKNIGKNTFMGKKQDRYGNRWIWDEDNKEAPLIGVVKPKSITLTGFDKAFEFTKPSDFNSLSEKEKSYYNQLEASIKKYVDTRNKKLDKDRAFNEWAAAK